MLENTEVLRLLATIHQELRAIHALLTPKPDAENAVLGSLLEEIRRSTEGVPFKTDDLLLHCEIVAGESGDARLANAIQSALGRPPNTRALGGFLATAEGDVHRGLVLKRVRTSKNGNLWKVETAKRGSGK